MINKLLFNIHLFKFTFICSWILFLLSMYQVNLGYTSILDWLFLTAILFGVVISLGFFLRINELHKKFIKYLLIILFLSYCLAWIKDLMIYSKTANDENIFEMLASILILKVEIIGHLYSNKGMLSAISKIYRELMLFIQIFLYIWWQNSQRTTIS